MKHNLSLRYCAQTILRLDSTALTMLSASSEPRFGGFTVALCSLLTGHPKLAVGEEINDNGEGNAADSVDRPRRLLALSETQFVQH